jgi:hypothetical protein
MSLNFCLFPRLDDGDGVPFVLVVLSVRSMRRGETAGEDAGVGENVRYGVGGCEGTRVVHVREQIAHVGEVHLEDGWWSSIVKTAKDA